MGTISIESNGLVAIMAENSKPVRKTIFPKPFIKRIASAFQFGAVFCASASNVVNGKKLNVCFSTTSTLATIMIDEFKASLESPSLVTLRNLFGMVFYPLLASLLIASGILIRPLFSFVSGAVFTDYSQPIMPISVKTIHFIWEKHITGIAKSHSWLSTRSIFSGSSVL